MKIVINCNACFFSLSKKARKLFKELSGNKFDDCGKNYTKRNNPFLVEVVERLGEEANGDYAILKIVEIPDDVDWEIAESFPGDEWVQEKHRTWR